MNIVTRKAARVLLINKEKKLLLMCIEDFNISTLEGKKNKRFWCTIGGKIEEREAIEQAALREIYEETGIEESAISLGPVVWHGEVDLQLKGIPTRLQESYIIAKTTKNEVDLHQPTQDEQETVKKMQWFSLDDIKNCPDPIFPSSLSEHLPEVVEGRYPQKPIQITL